MAYASCTGRPVASPNCSSAQFRPREGQGFPHSHTAQESQVGDPSADGIWPTLLPVLFTFSFRFIFNCTMLMHFQRKKKRLPTIDM